MRSLLPEFLEELTLLYHDINERNYEKNKERESKRKSYILERTHCNYHHCIKFGVLLCLKQLLLYSIV